MDGTGGGVRGNGARQGHTALVALQQDCFKMVGDSELADVVLWSEGERFPAHRGILAARSECFRIFGIGKEDGQRIIGRLGLFSTNMRSSSAATGGIRSVPLAVCYSYW